MNTTPFADSIEFNRGFVSSIPVEDSEEIGDAARDGHNCVFSPYGKVRSWRGISIINEKGAPHLMLVGDELAGLASGNILQAAGGSQWFVGDGDVFVGNFSEPIGTATSLLQFRYKGVTYQAGLPAPPAPLVRLATDSLNNPLPGRMTGRRGIGLTRRRAVVGSESPMSLLSNLIELNDQRLSVEFPSALTGVGQDEWGVYATRFGFEGSTPLLLRVVKESEIVSPIGASLASVNSTATTYTALSSVATVGRVSLIVLAPAAALPVTFRESTSSRTAGQDTRLRFTRTAAATDGDWLVVALTAQEVHAIAPATGNRGTVTIAEVRGAWAAGNTGGEIIDVEVLSATDYRWSKRSDGVWTTATIGTAPAAIGSTGLHLVWSAATGTVTEVGNKFAITPMSHVPPEGWTLAHVVGSATDAIALVVYTRQSALGESVIYDFTVSQPTQIFGTLLAATNAGSVSGAVSATTVSGTSHSATLGSAPTANHLIVANFAGSAGVEFTPQSPLIARVGTVAGARRLEFDFTDSDLLEVEAPIGVESAPAATHAFMLGQIMVLAGTLDGTAINPSQPNQFEQYDLANTAYLSPTERLVRVDNRPAEGSVYMWTANSLQVPVFTGDDDFPVIPRAIWPHTGIPSKNAACLTQRGAYAYTGNGPVRSNGTETPDSVFALPVMEYMRDWLPERVVVGHDEREGGMAVFCHEREMLVFYETSGLWSTPLRIDDFYYFVRQSATGAAGTAATKTLTAASNPWRVENVGEFITVEGAGTGGGNLETFISEVIAPGQIILRDAIVTTVTNAHVTWGADVTQSRIVSACQKNGELYLAVGDEAFSQLYKFDIGIGTDWAVRSGPRHGGAIGQEKTVRCAKLTANFDARVPLRYSNRLNVEQGGGRLTLTGGTTGYALSEIFVSTRQMHGSSIYWEWQIFTQSRERGCILSKASALHPRTGSLAAEAWGGGVAGWRVTDAGVLQVSFGGAVDPGFGGTAVDGDFIRLVLLPTGWEAYWLDANHNQKDSASSPFGAGINAAINEPIGVKPYLVGVGAWLDLGYVGRGNDGVGCLNLYDNYEAKTPAAQFTYTAEGLREYDWEKMNYKGSVYGVEVCGVGADQSPARILVRGRWTPGQRAY